ncbi:hypothetical protein RR46_01463 [Papilio xuthus]|uniref:Uncharacterized protein n=1 Tax=Papilio xuthus TaxID=66420 RepID=A0A0N1IMV5_PAPXU|nr:hypothetical protein RR46_01463 [Papilio xuthus]
MDIQGNRVFSKESPINLEKEIEKVLPLSKGNTLRQLLDNYHLNNNYKTKITVQYEIPNEPNLNCKEALLNILQVLKNANLMHESYRSCGPYDINCEKDNVLDMKNVGNQNVFTTNINQGNNNYLPNMMNIQKTTDSNLLAFGDDINAVLKYLASKRNPNLNSIFENYETKQKSFNDIKIPQNVQESMNKLTQGFNKNSTEFVENKQTNYSHNSTPYKLHITENIVPSTNLNAMNQKLNINDILAENTISVTQIPLENNKNQVFNVNEKADDVLVTVTNDGKIVSVYPSNNNLFEQGENNIVTDKFLSNEANVQNKESVARHVKNLLSQYMQGDVNNIPKDKMNVLLDILKKGSKTRYPQEILNVNEHLTPYYLNPNLIPNTSQYPMTSDVTNSIRQYENKEGLNDQLHANLNVFNQITNQDLLNQNSANKQYVTGNPYVNSKLVDYEKHVKELHAPYNLDNSQRFITDTNQGKLNFTPDNSGVVELTYLLKRPHPVIYQPVYYVKYRLPYDSFVNNLRDLVRRQPQLRSNRAKLYQELLSLSKVADLSPNLKGLGQQELLQMVANNGALVKTKVLKVNETLLDKEPKPVQDLNSNLLPQEINNETYKDESNGVGTANLLNKTIKIVLNKTKIEELENIEKAKLTQSNLSEDIYNTYQTATNKYGISTDKNPSNSMYPLV